MILPIEGPLDLSESASGMCGQPQNLFKRPQGIDGGQHKPDLCQHRALLQVRGHGSHDDVRCTFQREPVCASAQRWDGDGLEAALLCQREDVLYGLLEQLFRLGLFQVLRRSHMNDLLRQLEAWRQDDACRPHWSELGAVRFEFGARCGVDRAGHP